MGRHRTCDAKPPFIVDMPAPMLKRHAKLSKGARMLYGTMRALANGKTGELSIGGGPLDWQFIRKRAEICRNVWLRLLKELTAAGLVSCTRERVFVYRKGRKYAVLGRAHYFVHKLPKPIKKPRILLKSLSCTVQEKDSQVLSTPPYSDSPATLGSESEFQRAIGKNSQSSSPKKADDDVHVGSLESTANPKLTINPTPNPFLLDEDEALIRSVQERLRVQYPQTYDRNKDKVEDPSFIFEAIQMIGERGSSATSMSTSQSRILATPVAK